MLKGEMLAGDRFLWESLSKSVKYYEEKDAALILRLSASISVITRKLRRYGAEKDPTFASISIIFKSKSLLYLETFNIVLI